jgi:FkbM family methyltransferase
VSRKLARLIAGFGDFITLPQNARRRALTKAIAAERLAQTWVSNIDGLDIQFYCPTGGAISSAHFLGRGEPETIEWIRRYIKPGEVLWDIGANVGPFALYAAKREAKVFAFEPHAYTFAVLMRNVQINRLEDRIVPLWLALSDRTSVDSFFQRDSGAGHAMSALRAPVNVSGSFVAEFRQPCLAITADEAARIFALPKPDHIKLDVDGHEPEILEGAKGVLSTVKSVCVELLPENPELTRRIVSLLEAAGLKETRVDVPKAERNTVFTRG